MSDAVVENLAEKGIVPDSADFRVSSGDLDLWTLETTTNDHCLVLAYPFVLSPEAEAAGLPSRDVNVGHSCSPLEVVRSTGNWSHSSLGERGPIVTVALPESFASSGWDLNDAGEILFAAADYVALVPNYNRDGLVFTSRDGEQWVLPIEPF